MNLFYQYMGLLPHQIKLALACLLVLLGATSKLSAQNPAAESLETIVNKLEAEPSENLNSQLNIALREILTQIKNQQIPLDSWPFGKENIERAAKVAAQSQAELPALLADLYQAKIIAQLHSNQLERVTDNYMRLLEYRPDPSRANDELRMQILLEAETPEAKEFARGRLLELDSNLNFSPKKMQAFRLILKGYRGEDPRKYSVMLIAMFLLLLAYLAVRILFPPRKTQTAQTGDQGEEHLQEEGGSSSRNSTTRIISGLGTESSSSSSSRPVSMTGKYSRKYIPGYARKLIGKDEYSRLLEILDLEDDASEAEIKKAYRDKVKALHPDSAGEMTSIDKAKHEQDFIELREVYDRILQIRGSWFGGG